MSANGNTPTGKLPYPAHSQAVKNTGGMVEKPAQSARTSMNPGPNIGLRGTIKN